MKKPVLFAALPLLLALTMLSGCVFRLPYTASSREYTKVEHTGEVPEEFKKIVEENLFYDVKISKGRILKVDVTDLNKAEHTYKIKVTLTISGIKMFINAQLKKLTRKPDSVSWAVYLINLFAIKVH